MKAKIITPEDQRRQKDMRRRAKFTFLADLFDWLSNEHPSYFYKLHTLRGVLSISDSKYDQRGNRYSEPIIINKDGSIMVNREKYISFAHLILKKMEEI